MKRKMIGWAGLAVCGLLHCGCAQKAETDCAKPTPGQRVDGAIDKGDSGLKKWAKKTGKAMQDMGKKLENKALEE